MMVSCCKGDVSAALPFFDLFFFLGGDSGGLMGQKGREGKGTTAETGVVSSFGAIGLTLALEEGTSVAVDVLFDSPGTTGGIPFLSAFAASFSRFFISFLSFLLSFL